MSPSGTVDISSSPYLSGGTQAASSPVDVVAGSDGSLNISPTDYAALVGSSSLDAGGVNSPSLLAPVSTATGPNTTLLLIVGGIFALIFFMKGVSR